MSDLLDAALERWDDWQLGDWPIPDLGTMDIILAAARLAANPNKDAVRRFVNGYRIYPYDLTRFVDGIVAAAFTPQEDTLKSLTTRTVGNPDTHFTPQGEHRMSDCEKCDICGWPLSVTAQGLICLDVANHPKE